MAIYADRVELIGTENAFRIGPYIREVEAEGHRVIKCNLGEPDFALPAHIREEVIRQLEKDNVHYCDPQGILPLREAVARHFSDTRGVPVTADRVVVFCGGKPPIGFSQQAYVNPGDEVVYPSPGFPIYESFTRYVGAEPVPVHLKEEKGFALDGDDLAPLLNDRTKLVFLNFPSNPTGGVASEAQLRELAQVIVDRAAPDVRVYSDEVYEDIIYDGASHHSIASVPGMAERTIIVGGASKSFSWTGGRIGWAAFPTVEEARVFANLNINYYSCVPPYNQEGAREGIESPLTKPFINTMLKAFHERRDTVISGLNAIDGITCARPGGAFYAFPNISGMCENLGAFDLHADLPDDVRSRTSPSTMIQMFLLYRYYIASVDRASFGRIGTERLHFLRLSIATGIDDLREAVTRIGEAAHDRNGFKAFIEGGGRLC